MVRALGDKAPKDPAALEALLKSQIEKIAALEGERDVVFKSDPEIARLSALADQASREGAIETALKLHEQTKARVEEISNPVDEVESSLKARRLEFGEVFARSAKDNYAAFRFEQAAIDYGKAFQEVERWDDFLAWSYRGNQAQSLQQMGWNSGSTESLRAAVELAPDVVRLAERLENPEYVALSHTLMGNTLMTLGQRTNDREMISQSAEAYKKALSLFPETDDPAAQIDILQNIAGAMKQVAQRQDPAQAKVKLAEAVEFYDELLAALPRERDALKWSTTAVSKGMTLNDLSRYGDDPAPLREAISLLDDVVEVRAQSPDESRADALCVLAVSWAELGKMTKDRAALDKSDDIFKQCIELTDRTSFPVDYGDRITGRAQNFQMIHRLTDDPAWLDKAVLLAREARDMLDPVALPTEWQTASVALGGQLIDAGRATKDPAFLREALAVFQDVVSRTDKASQPEQWADNLSRLADARRNFAEITLTPSEFTVALDELAESLRTLPADRFPDIEKEIRKGVSFVALSTSRLGDKLPEETARSLLQRSASLLERPEVDGPLSTVEAELGRHNYAVAQRANDTGGLRRAIDHYRRALVPDAKLAEYDSWATTQSNLGLALIELARVEKDNKLLEEAIAPMQAALNAYAPDNHKGRQIDRKRLAETYDKLGADGDLAWLRRAADAWASAETGIAADATAEERGYILTSRAQTLHNINFYAPGGDKAALAGAIENYRKAINAQPRSDNPVRWENNIRSLAQLLRLAGEPNRDAKLIEESVARYRELAGVKRTAGPQTTADDLSLASALVLLGSTGTVPEANAQAVAVFQPLLDGEPSSWSDKVQAHHVTEYAQALRYSGYSAQSTDTVRRAETVLAAYLKSKGEAVAQSDLDAIAYEQAETLLYLGDMTDDPAMLRSASSVFRDLVQRPSLAPYPQYLGWLSYREAIGRLVAAEISGNTGDWRDGLALMRVAANSASRTENPADWAQKTADLAFGIAGAARAGVTGNDELDGAVAMARDALAEFEKSQPTDVSSAQVALCSAKVEFGRATSSRIPIEEGLALCQTAAAAIEKEKRPWSAARIRKTITYGEGLLAKM